MKKLYSFFKSMRFGLILLVLIAVCSVIGSIIPQDKEISWYVQNYQDLHRTYLINLEFLDLTLKQKMY